MRKIWWQVACTNTLNKQFLDNHLLPLFEKLSHENKQILIMGDFNIDLLNYVNENTANFFDTCFPGLIYLLLTHPLE